MAASVLILAGWSSFRWGIQRGPRRRYFPKIKSVGVVCMYGHHIYQSMDQPGKVANPARGQLNRENEYFPVRVRAWESGLVRRVRQSRPASACSPPYSSWIWCLVTGFLPSSAAASIFYLEPRYVIGPVPSLSGHAIAYRWRSLPRVRRHRASKSQGTVVPNECCLGSSSWTN